MNSYGILETIAGKGQYNGNLQNYWQSGFEGAAATNVNFSRPHIALADLDNNILIVDEGSSSVLKLTSDGTIHTFAGAHTNGFNGDGPAPATNLYLNYCNGAWITPDGSVFIMDTFNSKIRVVNTNGIMRTLFTAASPIAGGRGLWVRSDTSEVWYTSTTNLWKWTPATGEVALTNTFLNLADILGDEKTGNLYISDRDANLVYVLRTNGQLSAFAGNGTTSGGGDGYPVLATGLNRPRCVSFLPNGGYFIAEHSPGCRIWYVDPGNIIHLWLNGSSTGYSGDGSWFFNPSIPKISLPRSVNTDRRGNIIIVDSDYGYVRRINFQRLKP